MLIALILNVFGHVTRPWCNAVLGLLNLLLETTLGKSTCPTIPSDIRTVRKKFDLDPVTQTFATCTRCSCTYPPAPTRKKSPYPERCTHQRYRGSKPCGQLMVKCRKGEGGKTWTPVRPYVVQDFNAFLAEMLSRPGIEEAMDRGTMMNEKYRMWDIKDGTVMQEILGADGKPFLDGGNKTSGKKKSVGSIAMGLLNLPPSLRYKPENMYLVGIIPGPREPALDEINHFLRPVVDFFVPSWKDGTRFTRTFQNAAARKLAGCAGPTANQMCGLWCSEHRAAAEEWKSAETKSERDKIFKRHGVRWSELLRLPYWDPVRFVVVDGMHNLFLGLVQHHFRDLIIIDKQAGRAIRAIRKPDKRPVSAMTRLRLPVLEALIQEAGLVLSGAGKRSTKTQMAEALLVRCPFHNHDPH